MRWTFILYYGVLIVAGVHNHILNDDVLEVTNPYPYLLTKGDEEITPRKDNITVTNDNAAGRNEIVEGSNENIVESNDNVTESHENIGVSNEDVDVSNENVTESNENVGESNENVEGSTENVAGSNENVEGSNENVSDDNVIESSENIEASNENVEESTENVENSNENVVVSNENIGIPESNENENQTSSENNQSTEDSEPDTETSQENVERSNENLEQTEIIETTNGPVRGQISTNYKVFLDIPYGVYTKPFTAPTEPENWYEPHEVFIHSKRCPQIQNEEAFVGDLDCLTLTVFTPLNAENAPVLFHIYDAQFTTGSADPSIYGPDYFATNDVILVLPNYRLGVLGFLCLHNDDAPGNAALKDLTLALDWTMKNIEAFGGNRSNIIVSGDGTAGSLAGYLALSPSSRDYITGVISESGAVLADWALDRDPAATEQSATAVLQGHITEDIDVELLMKSVKDIRFRPCVEIGQEPFMNETPWQMLQRSENIDKHFMIGSANHAGMHEALKNTAPIMAELNNDFSSILPKDLKFDTEAEKLEIAAKIRTQYFGDKVLNIEDTEQLSLCYTDALYLGPAIRSSRALVNAGAKVYFYEFSFVGDMNRELNALSGPINGAARGDIVGYVFVQDEAFPQENTEEETVVKTLTNLWTSFIKTGTPSAENVNWEELQGVHQSLEAWLSIGSAPEAKAGLHEDRLALWSQIYEEHFIETNAASGFNTGTGIVLLATLCKLLAYVSTDS